MAIVKVGTYRNPPVDITDYEAIVSHLEAYTRQVGNQGMILTEWTNTTNAPKIAMGSYISHGGVLYVVDTEDYAISFPTTFSQVWYIVVQASGESLSISVAFDPSPYSWNAIYNGLYDSLGKQLLPYKVWAKPAISVPQWNKYKLLNPAHIEVYKSLWVDYLGNLESAGIYANGPIECDTLNITTLGNRVYSSPMKSASESYVIPIGMYYINLFPNSSAACSATLEIYDDVLGDWRLFGRFSGSSATITLPINQMIISDGTNVRISVASGAVIINMMKIN